MHKISEDIDSIYGKSLSPHNQNIHRENVHLSTSLKKIERIESSIIAHVPISHVKLIFDCSHSDSDVGMYKHEDIKSKGKYEKKSRVSVCENGFS